MISLTKEKKLINLRNSEEEKKNQELTAQEKFILSLEKKAEKGTKEKNPKKSVTKRKSGIKENKAEKSFRMISKISPQKRKKRYNIFIDGQFAFGVDEEVLIKFNLTKGIHVSKELQEEIESEESYYKAYQRTLNYLTYSLRSEKQIRDYLKKHDASQFSDRMVEHFKELKLIDDLNYAESYVRTMANVNRKGPKNIERDLDEKGISEENKMQAMEEYTDEQQLENAKILAKKRWARSKKDSRVEGIQKVKQYLVNKGYSFKTADEVINQMDTEVDEEAEYTALVKQADRAIRRYSRKHEGYELVQRLKRYLYSKSFPSKLINRFIDERNL